MKLQGRNLKSRMIGPDVALLHSELEQLGFTISVSEMQRTFFGKNTATAVREFQKAHHLTVDGVVDKETARLINAEIDALPNEGFVVRGKVRNHDRTPRGKSRVQAFDKDLRALELLGEILTDAEGGYEITYNADQFSRVEKGRADLLVRVVSDTGAMLAESDIVFNASPVETINLEVAEPPTEADLSELERLLRELSPLLDGVRLFEMSEQDAIFLAGETRGELDHILFLAEGARLARQTRLSTAVFYALARTGLELKLEVLLGLPSVKIHEALKLAINDNIVPQSMAESFDEILARFAQLRLEQGVEETYPFFGELRRKDQGDPLPGLRVCGLDLDADSESAEIGCDISNVEGRFALTYVAPAIEQPDSSTSVVVERRLRFLVSDDQGTELHQEEITIQVGSRELIEVQVPIPEEAPPSTPEELKAALNLPEALVSALDTNGIASIGGIINAVANTTRADLVSNFHEASGGDLAAFSLHAGAIATKRLLDNVTAGLAADAANGLDSPLAEALSAAALKFAPRCGCDDFESAISPLAYLADLLDYATKHLKIGDDDAKRLVTLADLETHLHQPFGQLPVRREVVETELTQIRLCVEGLRDMAPHADLDPEALTRLARQEREYLFFAYRALLGGIGTSFEKLRAARTDSEESRERLAARLGISLEHLADLFFDPEEVTELDLDRLFGLPDTTRDVLSSGAKLDDPDGRITRWFLKDARWGHNTDPNGRIYLSLSSPAPERFVAEVFKDAERETLVASGERDQSDGPVALQPVEGSGLWGTIEAVFGPDNDTTSISLTPQFLSHRLAFLRETWLEQDHPDPDPGSDAYPIVDPDLIGPADLYLREGDLTFQLWQQRQEQVDELRAEISSKRDDEGLSAAIVMALGQDESGADIDLEVLQKLQSDLEEGKDIEAQLQELHLELAEFSHLMALANLLESGENPLASELAEIDAILTQGRKRREFSTWRGEERDDNITLSPDHFRLAEDEPEDLPQWLASRSRRREWHRRLQARTDEEQGIIESFHTAVREAEEASLIILRDALIEASDATTDSLNTKAERVTRSLLIDAKAGTCQHVTRAAMAIETVQALLTAVTTGAPRESLPLPDLVLDADHYEEEWQWLGSYETWRAAVLVFLYPENVLLPSLRNDQTPGFKALVEEIRENNRLTPEYACAAAQHYARYFRDVCSMRVDTSCNALTQLYTDDRCRERIPGRRKDLFYFFGLGGETGKVYWSTVDPRQDCGREQSYWAPVPGLDHAEAIIGAVPFRINSEKRFVCLFVQAAKEGEQKLLLMRYDLEASQWEEESQELELPRRDGRAPSAFTAVARQRAGELGRPHLAIYAWNAIYDRRLNRKADDWENADNVDSGEFDGDWHLLSAASATRKLQRIWAMVELDANSFYLFAQDRDHRIRYRLFGASDDGYWHPRAPSFRARMIDDPNVGTDSDGPGGGGGGDGGSTESGLGHWAGEPIGAFKLVGDKREIFAFWRESITISPGFAFFALPDRAQSPFGPTEKSYYRTITTTNLVQSTIRNLDRFDRWLKEVSGLSLNYVLVVLEDQSKHGLLSFLNAELPEPVNSAAAAEIKKQKKNRIELAGEFGERVRSGQHGTDWRWADAMVFKLTNGKESLGSTLVKLVKNAQKDEDHEIEFEHRIDNLSSPSIAASGLARISPAFSSSDVNIVVAMQFLERGYFRGVFTPLGNAKLEESERLPLSPRCTGPLEITEKLTDNDRKLRQNHIAKVFAANKGRPRSNLTYLEEAYYFVPVFLALQLRRRTHYSAALRWLRTVYDYGLPEGERKLYRGLVLEERPKENLTRADNWLRDPLNPHAVAGTRANVYTRFTLIAIVECILEFADAEFALDTAESVKRARNLYLLARDLLASDALKLKSHACLVLIEELDVKATALIESKDVRWLSVWNEARSNLSRIGDRQALEHAAAGIRAAFDRTAPLSSRLTEVRGIVAETSVPRRPFATIASVDERRQEGTSEIYSMLIANPDILDQTKHGRDCFSNEINRTVSVTAGLASTELLDLDLSALRMPLRTGTDLSAMSPVSTTASPALGNPLVPSRTDVMADFFRTEPVRAIDLFTEFQHTFLPSVCAEFCVPPNPVLAATRRRVEVNLFKIRTCRNIAGDERQLEPYAASTNVATNLPAIGSRGTLVLPGTHNLRPTQYRYSVLIERAKQLVGLAQQIEAAFLSALEKRDAEFFQLLRARQEVRLSRAGIRLQDLRVRGAEDSVKLAQLQRARADIQFDHFGGLLNAGLLTEEQGAIAALILAAAFQTASIVVSGIQDMFSFGLIGNSAGAAAQAASATASLLQFQASLERRRQEWALQRELANQDRLIGQRQIQIAKNQLRVTGQERNIAQLQSDHAEATAEFFATKFTSAELYEWMSEVLEGVYSFFLQQATTNARLAEVQLAFERQELTPQIIQSDYWEAPLGIDVGTGDRAPDRRGLTGSARLLRDVSQLDQFAFDTNKRKLQLTKTISLAQMAPVEFQRFRETGLMRFDTTLEMFDRDFPGHYLRLINRVRTSVIALIPPTLGIKATLATSGQSRVVLETNGAFLVTPLVRPPESTALTSPREATGLFELTPQSPELLRPFEYLGVATSWELRLPKPANPFDFDTIADVLLTIEYTALDSLDYRRQIISELDNTVSADRPFSFRYEFADAWYDLHNPPEPDSNAEIVVKFETQREDFPPNLDDLKIEHVVLFFSRSDKANGIEVSVEQLHYSTRGANNLLVDIDGESLETIDGIISTRRGNAGDWTNFSGNSPIGEWELTFQNVAEIRGAFENEEFTDILFAVTYTARTTDWPK